MVVHRVPCSCGQAYVGKTDRRLESKIQEHRDACDQGKLEKSAIAEHAWKHAHPIEWNATQVLDRATGHTELLVKVVLHIPMMTKDSSLNRDGEVELHDCWVAEVKKSEHGNQYHQLNLNVAQDSHVTQRCKKQL